MALLIPVSPGELIDKATILEIKLDRISDVKKRANVNAEYQLLKQVIATQLEESTSLGQLKADLKAINLKLWDIEDEIRDCESNADFGEKFIRLARSVYFSNDERAALKRKINELLDSDIAEEKSYRPYR